MLSALVRNRGSGRAAAATLRFYRSADATVSSADAEVGSLALDALAAYGTRSRSVDVTAPAVAGVYYYGACVDGVADESETANNCSQALLLTVTEGAPDLVVAGISVDESTPDAGESFTLGAVARNLGHGSSAATTLRYYRSDDADISAADAEVGNANVRGRPARRPELGDRGGRPGAALARNARRLREIKGGYAARIFRSKCQGRPRQQQPAPPAGSSFDAGSIARRTWWPSVRAPCAIRLS